MEKSDNARRIEIQRLKDLRTVADAGIGWMERAVAAEASLASLKRGMEAVSDRYAAACIERNQAEAELAAERARFDWWFGPAAKDINEYLRGVREGWPIEQWRAWIDAAKGSTEEGREQR